MRLSVVLLTCAACAAPASEVAVRAPAKTSSNVRLTLDTHALDALELPNVTGKPFVRIVGEAAPLVLVEDAPDHFTVWDGAATTTHSKISAGEDAPAPDRFERIDDKAVTSFFGRRQELGLDAVVFAWVFETRGDDRAAESILEGGAKDNESLARRVREIVASRIVTLAVRAYGEGGTRAELERRLVRARTFEGTNAARYAASLIDALRAPPIAMPQPRSALDVLVEKRVAALADDRCPYWDDWHRSAIGALGKNARAALDRAKDDPHPSRCVEGGEGSICAIDPAACSFDGLMARLVTVGELARRELLDLERDTSDANDVDCNTRGLDDSEAVALVTNALAAGDAAAAIDVTKTAVGAMRAHMVERLATSSNAAVLAFLADEASASPVLAARMAAAKALRSRTDPRWARFEAVAIDQALRSQRTRCDWQHVSSHLREVLTAAPAEVKTIAAGYASYRPEAKLDAAHDVLVSHVALTGDGAAIIALALADTRPVPIDMTFTVGEAHEVRPHVLSGRKVSCHHPSPSDIAATILAERLHFGYGCDADAADKALVVQKILAARAHWPTRP